MNFTDNRVDPNTGTLQVRGLFPNPLLTEGVRLLSPGMFVRVRLRVSAPHEALLIREQALGTDQGQKFIYVVNKDNVVEQRKVTIGPKVGDLRAIESGIESGDRVVVAGILRAIPGQTVDPVTIAYHLGARKVILFADYRTGGEHRAAVEPQQPFRLVLGANEAGEPERRL